MAFPTPGIPLGTLDPLDNLMYKPISISDLTLTVGCLKKGFKITILTSRDVGDSRHL